MKIEPVGLRRGRKKAKSPWIKLTKWAFILATIGLIGLSAYSFYIIYEVKDELRDLTRQSIYEKVFGIYEPTIIYSRDGKIIGRIFERYWEPVRFEDIPEHVVNAFLAAEDEDFFKHKGIDISSIIRATLKNLLEFKIKQGGSTITQQFARNVFLGREKTLARKIKEIYYAVKIERELTKEEIFSLYISTIFFGNGAYGIKSAVRNYFNKELKNVNLAEAAILASLPKSPVYYSPFKYPERLRARQEWILKRMLDLGYINQQEYSKAIEQKIRLSLWKNELNDYFWFAEEVRRRVIQIVGENEISKGFQIFTTLDTDCYRLAENSLRWGIERTEIINGKDIVRNLEDINQEHIRVKSISVIFPEGKKVYELWDEFFEATVIDVRKDLIKVKIKRLPPEAIVNKVEEMEKESASFSEAYINPEFSLKLKVGEKLIVKKCGEYFCPIPKNVELEGAVVVLNSQTGDVLCIAGGYSLVKSQFIRATQAKRQVGSAFKPIVYTAAIESGLYTPATVVKDAPIIFEYKEGDEVKEWKPKNFDEFSGWVTLQEALAKSINNATIRVAQDIGISRIRDICERLGISEKIEDYTVALGSISLSPLEVAQIYTPFSNGGNKVKGRFIDKIVRKGDIIFQEEIESNEVLSPSLSFVVAWMMRNTVLYGTGWRAKAVGIPIAGKTGTSNQGRDTWFVGITPEIVVTVWVGKDNFSPIGGVIASGPSVAVPIFVEFMKNYKSKLKAKDWEVPEGVEFIRIDPITGEKSDRGYLVATLEGTFDNKQFPVDSTEEGGKTSPLDQWNIMHIH